MSRFLWGPKFIEEKFVCFNDKNLVKYKITLNKYYVNKKGPPSVIFHKMVSKKLLNNDYASTKTPAFSV